VISPGSPRPEFLTVLKSCVFWLRSGSALRRGMLLKILRV
jgi:hypothetical protein